MTMTQASVRLADRVVLQVGESLGEQLNPDGTPLAAEIVNLTDAQRVALRDAFNAPHSRVYLSAAGAVTFDPPDAPPPPAPLDADGQRIYDYMPVSGSPAAAAVTNYIQNGADPALRATMATLRALIRKSWRERNV